MLCNVIAAFCEESSEVMIFDFDAEKNVRKLAVTESGHSVYLSSLQLHKFPKSEMENMYLFTGDISGELCVWGLSPKIEILHKIKVFFNVSKKCDL
jgi:hypothetical protein